jgi:hypothetical protein
VFFLTDRFIISYVINTSVASLRKDGGNLVPELLATIIPECVATLAGMSNAPSPTYAFSSRAGIHRYLAYLLEGGRLEIVTWTF